MKIWMARLTALVFWVFATEAQANEPVIKPLPAANFGTTDLAFPEFRVTNWSVSPVEFEEPANLFTLTVDTPPSVAGRWAFMQVIFLGEASRNLRPFKVEVYNPAIGSLPGELVLQKTYDRSVGSADFDASRYPQTIPFPVSAESLSSLNLRFSAPVTTSTSANGFRVKTRFFYRPAPAPGTDFSEVTFKTPGQIVMAGQDVPFGVTLNGHDSQTIQRVDFYIDGRKVGTGSYQGAGTWISTIGNIPQGEHRINAFAVRANGSRGWVSASGHEITADWFGAHIAFADIPAWTAATAPESFLPDRGRAYSLFWGISGVDQHPPGQVPGFPAEAEWKFGWINLERNASAGVAGPPPAPQPNTPVKRDVDPYVLYDSFCNMQDTAGRGLVWEIQVPEGMIKYEVVVGDSADGPHPYELEIEGKKYSGFTQQWAAPRNGWHALISGSVEATDGRLTVRRPNPDVPVRLNFIGLEQTSSGQVSRQSDRTRFLPYYGEDFADPDMDEAHLHRIAVTPLSGQTGGVARGFEPNRLLATFDYLKTGVLSNKPSLKQNINGHQVWWTHLGGQPFVAFGASKGGSPIYRQIAYSCYLEPGLLHDEDGTTPEMRVAVYPPGASAPSEFLDLQLDELNEWHESPVTADGAGQERVRTFAFPVHDLTIKVELSGLAASIPGLVEVLGHRWNLTHKGGRADHTYVVESFSSTMLPDGSIKPISRELYFTPTDAFAGDPLHTPLFSFTPEEAPPITSNTAKPWFEGAPRPVAYYGASASELLARSVAMLTDNSLPLMLGAYHLPPHTNLRTLTDAQLAPLLALDSSPELRSHTILDEFVTQSMKSDPIALANFVQNEIELSEPIGQNQSYESDNFSIDPGGIQRGALGCFLERQGSPHEQCALLVYLLRKAGFVAVYMETTRNHLLMDTGVVSRMLSTKLSSLQNAPSLVALNYPWVVAKINGQWVHLFPWIKDIEVTEGHELYSLMPKEADSGWKWAWKYFQGDEDVLPVQLRKRTSGLSSSEGIVYAANGELYEKKEVFGDLGQGIPEEYADLLYRPDFDQPYQVFPKYLRWKLKSSGLEGLSLDDIGIQKRQRRHSYTRWEDFPKPTQISGTFKARTHWIEVPRLFDTIRYEVVTLGTATGYSTVQTRIDTGEILVCDLHNRRVTLQRYKIGGSSDTEISLVMEPFDPFNTTENSQQLPKDPYATASGYIPWDPAANYFGTEGRSGRCAKVDDNPNEVVQVRITHKRHRQSLSNQGEGRAVDETLNTTNRLGLHDAYRYSDLALNEVVGGFEYQEVIKVNPGIHALCVNLGRVTDEMREVHLREIRRNQQKGYTPGNLDFDTVDLGLPSFMMGMDYWHYLSRFQEEIAPLHKVVIQGNFGHLFAGLELASAGATRPSIPYINIYRTNVESHIFGAGLDPVRNKFFRDIPQDYYHILGCQGSAFEHGVIERFWGQVGAISTMRLFHLAKASREAGLPGNDLVVVSGSNLPAIRTKEIPHEVEGQAVTTIEQLGNIPLNQFDPAIDDVSDFTRIVVAPKFYKYFDDGGYALDCAGYAEIPHSGIMGGHIVRGVPKSRGVAVQAMVNRNPATNAFMGTFASPQGGNSFSTTILVGGALPFSTTPTFITPFSGSSLKAEKEWVRWKITPLLGTDLTPRLINSSKNQLALTVKATTNDLTFEAAGRTPFTIPVDFSKRSIPHVSIEAVYENPSFILPALLDAELPPAGFEDVKAIVMQRPKWPNTAGNVPVATVAVRGRKREKTGNGAYGAWTPIGWYDLPWGSVTNESGNTTWQDSVVFLYNVQNSGVDYYTEYQLEVGGGSEWEPIYVKINGSGQTARYENYTSFESPEAWGP